MSLRLQKEDRDNRVWEKIYCVTRTTLDYIICIFLIAMLAVLPFYNEAGYSYIGTDKSTFFCRVCVTAGKISAVPLLLCPAAGLINFIGKGRKLSALGSGLHEKLSPTDIFALVYGGALTVSYILTDYREEALWGAEGWNMGFLPQFFLVCIYFFVSRLWKPRKWLFYLMLPVSGVVFLMGCVNCFGVYPFGIKPAGASFISTIGNVNWYCGYAVSVVFAGVVLLWLGEGAKAWQKILLMGYTVLGYVSLILQGSDSGLVALAVVIIVMFCMSAGDSGRMLVFWQEMILLWGGCLAIFLITLLTPAAVSSAVEWGKLFMEWRVSLPMTVVSVLFFIYVRKTKRKGCYKKKLFRVLAVAAVLAGVGIVLGILAMATANTLHPGILGSLSDYPLFTFNVKWGSNRGATWSAGWRCFTGQDVLHKLVGVGPDCMWSYIESGRDPLLLADVKEIFGSSRLTNAHNEWLTVLVDTGILGLIGFGGMIVCGIRELFRAGKNNSVVMACGFCLLAYTVNNIFSFQQAVSVGTVFAVFGMGEAFLRNLRFTGCQGTEV